MRAADDLGRTVSTKVGELTSQIRGVDNTESVGSLGTGSTLSTPSSTYNQGSRIGSI